MNLLRTVDLAAIGPLLILLLAALILLLLEAFAEKASNKYAFFIAFSALLIALALAFFSPTSGNPHLTKWLRFDSFSHFFTIFFLAIGLASSLLASSFFQRFEASHGEYYFLLLSSLLGLILISSSADFLTLFLGLETLSIPLYILCGYMKKWSISHEAAIKYFLIGAVATSFFLYGVAFIYGAVGTTQLEGLLGKFRSLSAFSDQVLFLGGIALVTLALAFKAAIVPFHLWAPDVYDGAPTPVTAFMAVGTKVGAFAAFALLFLVVLLRFNTSWNQGMAWLAIATLIYGNIVALRQNQLRRFFAYSGISHAGFLLMPIVASTPESMQALLFYLVIYAVATFGAFAILAFLDHDSKGAFLKDFQGLFYRAPLLATILTLCLLTLAGIPPTAGFFAKFYIFKEAFQAGYYPLVIVGLLTTIISAFYYLRIVSIMFSKEKEEKVPIMGSWPAAVVGAVSFAMILLFSVFPGTLLTLLDTLSLPS